MRYTNDQLRELAIRDLESDLAFSASLEQGDTPYADYCRAAIARLRALDVPTPRKIDDVLAERL